MIITEKKSNLKFNVRKDTYDEEVVRECFGSSYFKENIKYCRDDIVLDVGANIGAYAIRVSSLVQVVHSFEPDIDNYNLAKENLSLNSITNVHLNNSALISSDKTTIDFYVNGKANKGAHSCCPIRGREKITVPAKMFSTVVKEIKPTIVKMDIEGAEWDIITANNTDWSSVRILMFEWHPNILKDKTFEKRDKIESILNKHFDTLVLPNKTKAWTELIYTLKD